MASHPCPALHSFCHTYSVCFWPTFLHWQPDLLTPHSGDKGLLGGYLPLGPKAPGVLLTQCTKPSLTAVVVPWLLLRC